MTDWLYLIFKDGKLYEEDGTLYTNKVFDSESMAEQYLIDEDLRATIV